MRAKLQLIHLLLILLVTPSLLAQDNTWEATRFINGTQGVTLEHLDEANFSVLQLNVAKLKQQLQNAPLRSTSNGQSNVVIELPSVDGQLQQYRVVETAIFSSEAGANNHPEIKTYLGSRTDRSEARVRFSVTPMGLKAMISEPGRDLFFIQPVTKFSNGQYLVYNREARVGHIESFECSTEAVDVDLNMLQNTNNRDANDQLLRTYRIAISTTSEFTGFWDDGNASNGGPQEDALAQVVATLNRVNEVFETDMAINYVLVDTEDDPALDLIYSGTDPYGFNLSSQLQTNLTATVGEADYDIGHLFDYDDNNGFSGCIGCVCQAGKGSGFSAHLFTDNNGGPFFPDFFDVDYVPHEMGHQMGANHTFSFRSEGAGVNAEPGSGTTIMGYAGITGPNNVQNHSDAYFHYFSIVQILDNVTTAPNDCAITTAITNNAPVANAGSNYSIPQGTAFILKANATDADGTDILTYCWEQIDNGITTQNNFGPTKTTGALWRSRPPSTSPNRYMPVLERVLAGELTQINPSITANNTSWETVSTVARELDFALTVRDRSEAGGVGQFPQNSFDEMSVNVEEVPAFTVNTPPNWAAGSTQTASWVVGQTSLAPINCQNVNILFSSDGGATFIPLAQNTPNDGSQSITVPNVAEIDNARLWVEAADNIFYAVSPEFEISSAPDFNINITSFDTHECSVDDLIFNLDFATSNGFSENATFSVTGNPSGTNVTFSAPSLSSDGSFTMAISGLASVASNTYNLLVSATAGSISKSVALPIIIDNDPCASVANNSFDTSVTRVLFNTIDNVSAKPSGYSDYTAQVTDVNRESAYELTVQVNTDGDFETGTLAWIDWNQNCSFDDNESYNLGVAEDVEDGLPSNAPLSITVPADAVLGMTILRVSTRYASYPGPCSNGFDGEVEDYSLNVLTTLAVEDNVFENFSLFPNPNQGEFTIKLNSTSNQDIQVDVFDLRGRKVFNERFGNNSNFNQTLSLGNVQTGMYLVTISDGNRKTTKKIIIE
ncbi:T9SS type A sorting domain-containing protein [Subsaximicrobium wynnwilliamsii]|uniref:T9SS type A sorting domain-containing protein n=1 Tax=Subsaximicrobium wynnwilliamsii TaxID=291179 RepID=A0A5C6ZD35_9FLAO|nr:zinc-dependent metalloprotease family protein [Subsaximicrobium wynnwilliamsii]TXD81923.1 T9SS type A sorting domain-containing protein [Subsaximicrobium wynnwilliamsii]TXD87042.1 T9SS type A sorting domain-containing protein [Subsaximicrobium wynnwilliamsii]TXE01374.1 T9SS type A sorting domain-containing protein [Subsaximicrobium wynnwilliamsii]